MSTTPHIMSTTSHMMAALQMTKKNKIENTTDNRYSFAALSKLSLLNVACIKGDLEVIIECLNRGYDINEMTDERDCENYTLIRGTPLIFATRHGHLDSVKVLIERKANVNLNAYATTPLLEACLNKDYQIVDFLLKNGANPNYCPYNLLDTIQPIRAHVGKSPLHCAIDLTPNDCTTKVRNAYFIAMLLFRYGSALYISGLGEIGRTLMSISFKNYTSMEIATVLLIAREKEQQSPFYKDHLPLDVFKIIFLMACERLD